MITNHSEKNRGFRFRRHGNCRAERGASMVELAFILPILVVLIFGVVDLGRLIQARLVVTNVSREGGSLASRDIKDGTALISMLQSSASPLDLKNADGRIWLTKIKSGTTAGDPDPYIHTRYTGGTLTAASSITGNPGDTPAGLPSVLFNHLQYKTSINTSEISEVTIVEVFYLYRPVTPLPEFMQNLILPGGQGLLIGSKAVF